MRVVRTSYGQRIVGSFVGLIFGILLFFGSFIVLFLNEGRENLAKYARSAVNYNVGAEYSKDDLVYIIGSLKANTYAEDALLKPGKYIYLESRVEMFGYIEKEHRETKENVGGSSTTIITYSYTTGWTSSPQKAGSFKGDSNEIPQNIPINYDVWINNMPQNNVSRGSGLSINGVNLASSGLVLSNAQKLEVTPEIANTNNFGVNEVVTQGLIFTKNSDVGSINAPGVGDIRIVYYAITEDDIGILFGSIDNNSFTSFTTKKNQTFYRFFSGVDSQNHAVNILQAEYKLVLWILRLVGFFMMFTGLLLFTGPLTTFMAVIPIFAKVGRGIFAFISFVISFVLTFLTIILSIIFNNIYLSALFIILIIGITVLIINNKRKKKLEEQNNTKTTNTRKKSYKK